LYDLGYSFGKYKALSLLYGLDCNFGEYDLLLNMFQLFIIINYNDEYVGSGDEYSYFNVGKIKV